LQGYFFSCLGFLGSTSLIQHEVQVTDNSVGVFLL